VRLNQEADLLLQVAAETFDLAQDRFTSLSHHGRPTLPPPPPPPAGGGAGVPLSSASSSRSLDHGGTGGHEHAPSGDSNGARATDDDSGTILSTPSLDSLVAQTAVDGGAAPAAEAPALVAPRAARALSHGSADGAPGPVLLSVPAQPRSAPRTPPPSSSDALSHAPRVVIDRPGDWVAPLQAAQLPAPPPASVERQSYGSLLSWLWSE